MNNIKDILTHQKVTPSPDCWDKISSRLDIVMPQGAEQAASQAASATSQGGHLLGSLAAKIVAGVIGAATVVTVVTVAVTRDKMSQPAEEQHVAMTDTTSVLPDNADTTSYHSVPVTPNVLKSSEDSYSSSSSASVSADNQIEQNLMPTTEPVSNTPASSLVPIAPTSPHSPLLPSSPHVPLSPPSLHSSSSPANHPVAQAVQQDPVVQNLPEDAVDWTPPIKLEIPNVFTPNGDGINDRFVIGGLENCMQRQLVVCNRAGQTVYRSNSYENTWDGGDCPDGVYKYQFTYKGDNGIEQTMSGIVYIIRR